MAVSATPRTPWFFMSYGMGAESTAWVYRVLSDPSARPPQILPDYSNLVIATAQTGDEWTLTGELVTEHILPLIRQRNVRFIEVARKGPTKADGVAVLQDSRQPYRVHLDGVYRLSQENRDSGTMPILSGHHTCAQKSKGEPLDWWRAQEFGDEPYYHAIGFNVLEQNRIKRDAAYAMGGQRIPIYPLSEWEWTRDDCVDYLLVKLGLVWPKSCCRQCPYINLQGWPEQLRLFIDRPQEAVQHVIDEFAALALNARSGLYGPGRSLIGRLKRDGASEVIDLAVKRMMSMRWAVYRVRRRYNAPAIAPRSVQKLVTGQWRTMKNVLADIADRAAIHLAYDEPIKGAPKRHGEIDQYRRLWIRRRVEDSFPSPEEFLVAAPAQAHDKALSTFEDNWQVVQTDVHHRRARRVARATLAAAHAIGDHRVQDRFGLVEPNPTAYLRPETPTGVVASALQ